MHHKALARAILVAGLLCGASAADEDPRRPAAIETQEVPPVPADLAEDLRPYQNARRASFAGFAPQGGGILVRTRFGDAAQLHRVNQPGGRREQLTFFDEPVTGRFLPEADDGALLVSRGRGGDENYQVYLLEPRENRLTLLTDGASRNRLGPVRDDGRRVVIHSNRRNGRDTDLYLVDPRDPESSRTVLEADGEYWIATDFSPDGKRLALIKYVSINESYPALLDVESKELHRLPVPREGKVAFGTAKFAADGKSLYLTTDARLEFRQLVRYDPATEQYAWITHRRWDVGEVAVDRTSDRVAFTVNEGGASRLHLLAEGDERPRRLRLPLGIVSDLEFSPDGEHLGFTLSRPDAPSDAYTARVADGEVARWTFSEVGGLNPQRFVKPQRFAYETFDGRSIPAYIFRPQGEAEAPLPVVIHIHGGPEGQYRPYFSPLTQYLATELGAAVVAPNVRGSAGYGKSYLLLDNGTRREDSVRDIGALLDWIAAQDDLDARRVAVSGGSYGGYMVLGSLVHYSDRLAAGIDRVGIASFISFLERTSPYRRDLRRAEYGDERNPEIRAFFEKIDPVANAAKITAPLLVAHGKNDPRVPFYEARQIAEKVRSPGRPVWTLYADNEGHGFRKKPNRDYLEAVEVLFLKEHLGLENRSE